MQMRLVRWLVPLLLVFGWEAAFAQSAQAPAQAYTQAQLDQMLAPIALYPDPLLSQILMASTYPLEVVQAARWSDVHPGLEGDDAVRAVEGQSWDPSVKSLVAFPRVLAMMDERLDWTQALGEAFLEQEPYVMDTVQRLRERALAAGNLSSNEGMLVSQQAGTIVVEPANPQFVYVPYYDPLVVYGGWWWPAYPPVRWAPWPGYAVRPGISVGIYLGGGVRISAGFFFGAFDWHQHRVNIVRQSYYYRPVTGVERRHVEVLRRGAPVVWQHEAAHRRGIAYRNPDLGKRYPQRARPAPAKRETRQLVQPSATQRTRPSAAERTQPTPAQRTRSAPAQRTQSAPAQRTQPSMQRLQPGQSEAPKTAPKAYKQPQRDDSRGAGPRQDDQSQQGRARRDN
jgi:Protein of unknown function (DUF3300)